MKALNIILRIALGLLVLFPILGVLGIFPAPTPDLYNTREAYDFIHMLTVNGYTMYIMAFVFLLSLILIFLNRMALATALLLPIVVNILAFHMFLDGGLLTAGAIMADVFGALTIYFLYKNREAYKALYNYKS
ncbi:hypothetical protein BH11PAT3_BH11PAT3_1580 [soil metagenome]